MNDPRSRWARIEAALDQLLDLPETARAAALARVAGNDPELHRQLESLLAQVGGESPLLDRPAFTTTATGADAPGSLAAGTLVGTYRVVGLIGRGGMGEVYRAERADGQFQQQVALKLLRTEAAEHFDRFQVERQTLARLDHPGIARLIDGGIAADGRPYMAMELVEGRPITDWCRDRRSDLGRRLLLFMEVCEAVAYAHRNLVVHRDLKPGNVLVTADGRIRLLDFGIAKLIGAVDEMNTQNAPLTPGYAAPEQLTGGAVTTSTDVYALGMLLFELLTGARPWRLAGLPLLAALDKVLRAPPPPPSRFAATLPQPPVPGRLLRGDLDAIVAKAVRKEPERRYAAVNALREDVALHLRHEPVQAREGARLYVLGRTLRRHRVLAASGALVVASLAAGAAGMAWQAHIARGEAQKEKAVKDFLVGIFQRNTVNNPDGAAARQTTAEQLLDSGAQAIGTQLADQPEVRGELFDTVADLYDQLEDFDKVATLEREQLADLQRRDGDRPSTQKAAAQAELGRALAMTSRYADAEAQLRAALQTMDRLHDSRSPARVQALTSLGLVAYHTRPAGDPAARDYTQAALDILEKYNPRSSDVLSAVQLLARIAEERGEDTEAERGYRKFVALAQSADFRDEPVALADADSDLGGFLAGKHRYAQAAPMLSDAVAVLEKAAGPEHPSTVLAKCEFARVLAAMNRRDEAAALLGQALATLERNQAAGGVPAIAPTRVQLAGLELARGRFRQADALLAHNLTMFLTQGADELHYRAATLGLHASVLFEMGRIAEAGRELDQSEQLLARAGNPNSAVHSSNLVTAARLAMMRGDPGDVAGMFRHAMTPPQPDEGLPDAYLSANLGLIETQLQSSEAGALKAAQDLLDRILASPDRAFIADWEARSQQLLGAALLRSGQAVVAEPHLLRAVELRSSLDDPDSPWLAQARVGLATCLIAQRRPAEARRLLDLAAKSEERQTALNESYRTSLQAARAQLAAGR